MSARQRWLWLAGCLWLSACDSHDEDLRAWMDGARKRHHAAPAALSPAPVAVLLRYEPGGRSDPFSAAQLNHADEALHTGLQPDLQRAREPLESYSLASLRLIGSLRRGRDAVALIEVDQRVYTVRVGSHLGQDFGKVVGISERTVEVEELVPDSSGRWVQRRSQIALQETR